MKRNAEAKLIEWKEDPRRKPLILRGVRQCGKTWLLKEFGKTKYENLAYLSFDESDEFKTVFDGSKDPARIIPQLALLLKQPVVPGKTLLVLDEIQECPNALSALKYFQEKAPEYHVACAGSLLGISLSGGASFPVGKVDFLSVFPLTFSEFLTASDEEDLAGYLQNIEKIEAIPEPFFGLFIEKMKYYFITGGMPEAVSEWLYRNDAEKLENTISAILYAYGVDFTKHLSPSMSQRVARVWNSLPEQLSKENKKFRYKLVKDNANARDYEEAIDWLSNVSLAHRVNRCKAPGLPLSSYEDESSFKLYAADVGLLRRLSRLDSSAFAEGERLFAEFRGALSENYILQALTALYDVPLSYWTTYNPTYEVDFVLQHRNEIIPIEVKAGKDSKGKGLAIYGERYKEKTPLRVRFSMLNLNITEDLLNIPLFMADQTKRLIDLIKT